MKEALIAKLEKELALLEAQPDSDEYKNVAEVLEAVKAADIKPLEQIADKFTCNGADAWLNIWTNGKTRRIYINVKYKNGYRPNFKNNFIEF